MSRLAYHAFKDAKNALIQNPVSNVQKGISFKIILYRVEIIKLNFKIFAILFVLKEHIKIKILTNVRIAFLNA